MERIEKFTYEGKDVVCFNLSNIKSNEEFKHVIETAKMTISQYTLNSVYTLTDITNITFDTKTKELAVDWMEFNKPFVIFGTFIGVDGIKKIMMNAVFKMSGRKNVKIFTTKERVFDWLAQQ